MRILAGCLLLTFIYGCSAYPKLAEPVRMHYAVHVNDSTGLLGYVLCENYKFERDTMSLFNAGYYSKPLVQRRVTNIWYYGKYYQYYVVEVKETKRRYSAILR
jgi:hypothetical protein